MAWASDRQSLEQKRLDSNVDGEIANTDASMSRILINSYIAGVFTRRSRNTGSKRRSCHGPSS
jgi:hypothetical protein